MAQLEEVGSRAHEGHCVRLRLDSGCGAVGLAAGFCGECRLVKSEGGRPVGRLLVRDPGSPRVPGMAVVMHTKVVVAVLVVAMVLLAVAPLVVALHVVALVV